MSIVAAVICHRRPELLYHCLQTIPTDVPIRIYEDEGGLTDENREVANMCRLDHYFSSNSERLDWGCSHNAFLALADARHFAERVILIEDDVILEPDCIAWHKAQRGWCALSRSDAPIFSSLGTSWPSESIQGLLDWVDMAEYCSDLQGYCDRHFPQFPSFNPQFDGLLWRLVQDRSLKVDRPQNNLVRHVGSYGANTGSWHLQPVGSLADRIALAPLTDTLAEDYPGRSHELAAQGGIYDASTGVYREVPPAIEADH